jgi:uncharacterized protein (DUF1499 family)
MGLLLFATLSCGHKKADRLGLVEGKLHSCYKLPCVSSSHSPEEADRYIQPITVHGEYPKSFDSILKILKSTGGVEVVKVEEGSYVYATYQSSLFKFIDDMEFLFDSDKKVIFMRSSSRLGKYDFGANRKHLETVRFRFHQRDF